MSLTAGTTDATPYRTDGTATLTVNVVDPAADGPPALGGDGRASDPDGDGVYEDVTGDGAVDVLDVQTLLQHRAQAREHASAYDFAGDGRFDVLDVQTLLKEVTG